MASQDINFPVYRKYKNNKSYFKIINPKLFEEIQIIGSKKVIREVQALQFPEMSFVHDLIYSFENMAVEITGEEYETMKVSGS
ncbi:MAG: hypothetical protein K0S32_3552 [Bacteroidetes bacterium]|jgi:hypothetical protein|nr:hypothetical protein [Bacteroidota bacterium]